MKNFVNGSRYPNWQVWGFKSHLEPSKSTFSNILTLVEKQKSSEK